MVAQGLQSGQRMLGASLVGASAAVFGLAGALTKSIHADALTVACWRGLVGGLIITAYVLWRRRSSGGSLRLGWRGWLVALVGAAASVAFIAAFKNGFVANVAIIYATVPFAAALLSWMMLGETIRAQTMVAACVSLVGVGIMVSTGLAGGDMLGNVLAVVMTLLSALYMVLLRKFTETPLVWAGAVSAFLLFALGWIVTDPTAISRHDALVLIGFGTSFAVAAILWTEGARLIPPAEAGLIGSAEVPFAILFAWLVLAELPPVASLLGGAVVLGAVFAHAGLDWNRFHRMAALDGSRQA